MSGMLVSIRSVNICCEDCGGSEFGHYWNTARGKYSRAKLRRAIKHREKAAWKREAACDMADMGW